jgi:broad specificity phosphatase PhoE
MLLAKRALIANLSRTSSMSGDSDNMTRIILVRHGHVEGITPERFRGRRDVALSNLGVRQAKATALRIAQQWAPVTAYTSPLQRCVQTAAPIAAACSIPSMVLTDLDDVHYGDWEWCTHDAVGAQWPALYERWLKAPHLVRFPKGESLQEVAARVSNVLRLALERHRQQTVVVVGHSFCNRVLLLQTLDQPLSAYWRLGQDPCSLSEIEIHEHGTTVHRLNETQHLLSI